MQKFNFHSLPSLNALKAFESAARRQSFTLAAKELNVTQGAVSRQVKLLETNLGIILFQRHHRRIILTRQGTLLLQSLTMAFDIMADALKKIKNQEKDLSVKVHPTFAIRWLIPRLYKFQALYPDIQTRLTIVSINANFSEENFDAGITYMGEDKPGVCQRKILEERLIPVCSPKLLQGDTPLKKIEDLEHHVLLHNNPDLREWQDWARQMGIRLSFERSQVFEVDDAALRAAAAGLGVTLGDVFFIKEELSSGQLVAPFGYLPVKTGYYYFSWPDLSSKSQAVDALGKWIASEIDQELKDEPDKNIFLTN